MKRTGQRDTGAELLVRRAAYHRGLRYRVDQAPVPGLRTKPDLLFVRARVAVYIDGCFWHGCPQHATWPSKNAAWWSDKILTNRARDARMTETLMAAGWTVLRFWEHEGPEDVAARIEAVVRGGAGE